LREATGVTLTGPALSAFAVTRAAVAARLGLTPAPAATGTDLPSPRIIGALGKSVSVPK